MKVVVEMDINPYNEGLSLELVRCPECGSAASVEWRTSLCGVTHLKIRCIERHWYFLPSANVTEFGAETFSRLD
jgi:hypothetical protein